MIENFLGMWEYYSWAMPRGYKKRAEGASRKEKQGSSTKNSRKGNMSNKEWDRYVGFEWGWKNHRGEEGCTRYRDDPVGRHEMYDEPAVEPPSPERPPPRYIEDGFCLACMDEGIKVLDVGKCGHTLCHACLRRYYTQKDLDILSARLIPANVTLDRKRKWGHG